MMIVLSALAAILLLVGCEETVAPDAEPSFGDHTVADQTYTVGVEITALTLPVASGGDGALTYSLTPDVSPFGLAFDSSTRRLSGTPTAAGVGVHPFTYTATDIDGDYASLTFEVSIVEAPDAEPSFGDHTIADQTYTVGVEVTALTLPEASGGDGALTYSLVPDVSPFGLAFDSSTRRLSGTPTAAGVGVHPFTYTATDTDGDQASLTFVVSIVEAPDAEPSFGDHTVADQTYTVGVEITALTLPEASGGDGALTYSLTPDVSPFGLTFDSSTRRLSGTPTAAGVGVHPLTYTATDIDGDQAFLTFVVRVVEAPDEEPSFGDHTVADQTHTVGVEIAALTLPEASGGDGALTYSLTPDVSPFGLAFDSSTRRLSGTPTAAGVGVHPFTYTATDTDGDQASLTFVVSIVEAPDEEPSFGDHTVADQTYTVGVEITALTLPEASGGDGALTYSLTPDVSPFGLTFDSSTRRLSGTPTAAGVGVHPLTYTATDIDGDQAFLTFVVRVVEAPDEEPSFGDHTVADQTHTVGVEIAALTLPEASGGDGALTYSLTPDVSPFGLAFDSSTRRLSGTPTAAGVGVHPLTYTATDIDGDQAFLTFVVRVVEAPDEEPSFGDHTVADQTHTVGVEIAALTLPEASGGDGALTYSLTPDVSPFGLAFDSSTRRLSGTPTAAGVGVHPFTYTATDTDGDQASLTFVVSIVEAPDEEPSFGDHTVPDQTYTVGVEITALTLPEASGGDGALTYSLTPDVSPFGLAFDSSTRRLSGTPTAAGVGIHTLTYVASDTDGDDVSLTFDVGIVEIDLGPYDKAERDAAIIVDDLRYIAGRFPTIAERIKEMPFLVTIDPADMVAVASMRRLAERNELPQLLSHPALQAGISDEQAKIVATLQEVNEGNRNLINTLLDPERVRVEERVVRLPHTGKTLLAIIRTEPGVARTINILERVIRNIDAFMGAEFPANYLAYRFESGDWCCGGFFGTHTRLEARLYDNERSSDDWDRIILTHETAHYYWTGLWRGHDSYWVWEGGAELVTAASEHVTNGRPMDPWGAPCYAYRTLADLDHYLDPSDPDPGSRACVYRLGERLFLDMYMTLGEDAFRRGFRAYYLSELRGIEHIRTAFRSATSRKQAVDNVIDRWYYGTEPYDSSRLDERTADATLPSIRSRIIDAFLSLPNGDRVTSISAGDDVERMRLTIDYSSDGEQPFRLPLEAVEYYEDGFVRDRNTFFLNSSDDGRKQVWISGTSPKNDASYLLGPARRAEGRYWIYVYDGDRKVTQVEYQVVR